VADAFKKIMNKTCGIGGLHCDCCNDFKGKERNKLNQIARSIFRKQTEKEIDEGEIEWKVLEQ
jgi:hypothetical protein